MKICPHCAEEIQEAAIKCKHCGETIGILHKKIGCPGCFLLIVLAIVGIIIASVISLQNARERVSTNIQKSKVEEQVVVIFDLESLYKKNIDEIRSILGKPIDGDQTEPTKLQIENGVQLNIPLEWDNTFKKDEYGLLVTYDVASRKVIDFFIGTDDPSGLTKNIEKLKKILNVQNSINFTIKPVKVPKDPTSYTGIIVTPKK